MRSNRLIKGHDLADTPSDPTCPDSSCLIDKGVKYYLFNGLEGWPHYGHPEGMQTLGNMLVVGVDSPLGYATDPMQVLFIDGTNPESLRIVNSFKPKEEGVN